MSSETLIVGKGVTVCDAKTGRIGDAQREGGGTRDVDTDTIPLYLGAEFGETGRCDGLAGPGNGIRGGVAGADGDCDERCTCWR
jgi:hypothetical protein